MSYISQSIGDYANRFNNVRDYILYNLGYPVVRVELTQEHLSMAIIDAVTRYYDRAAMDLTCLNVDVNANNTVDIPESIKPTMIENIIFEVNLIDGFSKGMFVSGTEDAMGKYVMPFQTWQGILDNFDMIGYYMFLQRLEDFKKMLGIDRTWEIMNDKIYLYPSEIRFNRIGIVYKGNLSDEVLETEYWIKEYAYAKAKFMLGTIRSKMSGFQTAGGNIAADGSELKSEAKEEMSKLLEDLNGLQRPLPFLQV